MAPDYRRVLWREYENRHRANPRYSMRAYAKFLGISSARLSEILNGKQGLSGERAAVIAKRLGLSKAESEQFVTLVEARHSRSDTRKRVLQEKIKREETTDFARIQDDAFHLISDWYHFALLELLNPPRFSGDPCALARKLALPEALVRVALERLERLGMVRRTKAGLWSAKVEQAALPGGVPSMAVKEYHRQIMSRALQALYIQPIPRADFGAATFSLDPARVEEVRSRVRQFRRELIRDFGTKNDQSDVYCMATSLFSLTKEGEKT